MAGETELTIVGNLTADPELRTISTGASVCNFTIAATPADVQPSVGTVGGRPGVVHALHRVA